ncbi:MAG TPA: DUF222 domain-containing protein, partial [Candidatus Dormibacteraeota bacterium]
MNISSREKGGGALSALVQGIDAVAAEDIDGFTDAALGEDLVELDRAINRLEGERLRRLRRFHRLDGAARRGLSTHHWLCGQTRMTFAASKSRVETARALEELPETEAALLKGEIRYEHAAEMARTAEIVGAEVMAGAEKMLLPVAREMNVVKLRLATRFLRHCIDPDGTLKESNEAFRRRHVHLSQLLDGIWILEGVLDAEGGAVLATALDAIAGPRQAGDERSPGQR